MGRFEIKLEHVRMFARHGVIVQERTVGAEFEVNLSITCERASYHDALATTISYADLFAIVKREMEQPADLLETVAMCISDKILEQYPDVIDGWVSLTKFAPPIDGMQGDATVKYIFSRE